MNKPVISKLFKLKNWLTLPEASQHLSVICDEKILESDILNLALEGHLKLSVNFVEGTYAKEAEWIDEKDIVNIFPLGIPEKQKEIEKLIKMARDYFNRKNPDPAKRRPRVKEHEGTSVDASLIEGVWDLPLVGGERISIVLRYEELSQIPYQKISVGEGAHVEREGQLQEYLDDNYGYEDAYHEAFEKQFHKIEKLKRKTNNERSKRILE